MNEATTTLTRAEMHYAFAIEKSKRVKLRNCLQTVLDHVDHHMVIDRAEPALQAHTIWEKLAPSI